MLTPELEKMIMNIDMRTRRMENVLSGDKDFKIVGLVDKVEYNSKKINEFEKDKIKVVTVTTILGSIVAFFVSLFHKIYSN